MSGQDQGKLCSCPLPCQGLTKKCIHWMYIAGHSGVTGNEEADRPAAIAPATDQWYFQGVRLTEDAKHPPSAMNI